ncbi:MAG TPA: hypothetical protein VIV11_00370 [Kofleriaceae bacterium]
MKTQHIYLIPGFFGFVNFGRLIYYGHVRDYLEDAFARERVRVEIHRVRLGPTSSLRVRAAELLRFIRETAPADAPLHLVGHSTGGLDARLLTSPGLTLDGEEDIERDALRVKSVVSIASPHRGTPLAAFFASLMGQQVLRLLSLGTIIVLRRGRLPLGLLARSGGIAARLAFRRASPPLEMLEHLESELLGSLGEGEDQLRAFVRDVHGDQALMSQLTPAAMDLFESATSDRPGVRYACVTACAKPPKLTTRLRLERSIWAHTTYTLYSWLHGRVGDGDGIVPIASQRHGTVLCEARGDHLDVIGHFDDPDHRHTDWINTGSGFDRRQFEALWAQVARFIAASAR